MLIMVQNNVNELFFLTSGSREVIVFRAKYKPLKEFGNEISSVFKEISRGSGARKAVEPQTGLFIQIRLGPGGKKDI